MAVARKYPKRLPIVVVEWIDACHSTGWRDWKQDIGCTYPCVTVGMLAGKDARMLTVIQSAAGNEDWGEREAIPLAWIKRIRRVGMVELPK